MWFFCFLLKLPIVLIQKVLAAYLRGERWLQMTSGCSPRLIATEKKINFISKICHLKTNKIGFDAIRIRCKKWQSNFLSIIPFMLFIYPSHLRVPQPPLFFCRIQCFKKGTFKLFNKYKRKKVWMQGERRE